MLTYPCPRECGKTFPNPVARGEHALACNFFAKPTPKTQRAATPGKLLEELVKRSYKAQQGGALFLKKHAPAAVYGSGRVFNAGPLDFEGDYHGRAVMFDAKSCGTASLPLANMKRHQMERARKAHERGAVAFFLVEMRRGDRPRRFALPWPVMAPYLADDSRVSIPLPVLVAKCPEVRLVDRRLDLIGAIEAVARLVDAEKGGAA